MDPAKFERLQDLFDRLRDAPEPQWRTLVEGEARDDPEMRAELERLLTMDRDLGAEPPPDDAIPKQIGPYHILAEIGRGGMGTVYKAEQREPVRRLLALKVVQAGLRTKEVLSRFHVERKALAAMNHRHIAKVFDAGATESGQPFFAMELVEGLPLGEYCDRNRLSLPQRLRLFQQICEGVQHAHQKGVVHRDLKPGNVLVATEGTEPVPKIVDFGLAKATDRDFVDVSLITTQDQVLGTFEYMSPEQAHGDSELVDARADIYSLGVMLYELLCGELPFSTEVLRRSGRLEALRIIREKEPPKPSAKLAARPDRSELADLRRVSFSALHKALRGDLDWIALKAMAKEPERRYAAATLLAEDIQRHLDFEPVLATPPSLGYRVTKFVRRYRVQCIAAVLLVVTIIAGGVGTWLGFAGQLEAKRAESARNRVFADAARLAEARRKGFALYPAWPETIPAMQAWLAEYGEPLAERLPYLRAELDALRARARPRLVEPHESDADTATLLRLRSDLESEDSEPRRVELAERIRQLELEPEVRAFDFADANDTFVHGTLTRLVRDLEPFTSATGELAAVRTRLVEASTVRHRTIEVPDAAWSEAIAAIAASNGSTASPLYGNLALTPQLGLVPLGMDPESKLWEFVHVASGTPGKEAPVRDSRGRLVVTGDMGIVFVLLPGGKLPVGDGQAPQHRHSLRLDPFFLSKYELTHGQLLRLERSSDRVENPPDQRLPAVNISWFDCRDMLGRAALSMPTAMQWEYGCRGGTSTPWWTGSTEESLAGKENPRNAKGVVVGSLTPNPFGLFDTLGNVWELTRDEWPTVGKEVPEMAGDGNRPIGALEYVCIHTGSFDVAQPERTANDPADGLFAISPSSRYAELGVRPARRVMP